ncbi:hypothetical protein Poli38472_008711 [Pythium oligandrum]|uniref:Uncharacterized protein n=1 Tax=Pythium oligandrum TaxID=41045 RepID=A0A8K1C496_PYTOL|nr:hypothetical protein Poli38472_008711 [Pythium oligandrum]|eukprot:TMW56063.1 hypothetical protein Poli38472_008711 [Pythium oligandrum]
MMEMTGAEGIARRLEGEYELETERKSSILKRCGVAEEDLSKNGQMYLHVLAETAEILQLKDTQTSSYLMAISDLIDGLDEAEELEHRVQVEAEKLKQRSQELMDEVKEIEHVKQQLQEAVEERETHENSTTMEQRTAENAERQQSYEQELRGLEAALADLQFPVRRDRIEHHALAALLKDCDEIEAGNKELAGQLRGFHDLPLDKDAAAATLRQAHTELQSLEDAFNRHIRAMI